MRRIVPSDVEHLAALDMDAEVMRYINGGVPRPLPPDPLPRLLAVYEQGPGRGFWMACDPATGDCFGWFLLRQGQHFPTEIEVGYRLKRAAWGRGLATEGTMALIRLAFDVLNEPKVYTAAMKAHAASRRVMEKCGMTYEREFLEHRWPGADKEAVKYSILREIGR